MRKWLRSLSMKTKTTVLATVMVTAQVFGAAAPFMPSTVHADPGNSNSNNASANNGTLKVHEIGTPLGTESTNPHVCAFNLEGFGFDAGQSGFLQFTVQGNDAPHGTDAGPFAFGPTVATATDTGYAISQDFNNGPGTQTITDGHYTITLYGKSANGTVDYNNDLKAKSKDIKVECPATPTAGATVTACTANTNTTDTVKINVVNTADNTGDSVTYTVKIGSATQTITLADGANGNVTFTGLAAGTYTAQITGSDGTSTTTSSFTINSCPFISAQPTASKAILACEPGTNTTDQVRINVVNTADNTQATVTYTVTFAGQTKTITLADGANGNVTFTGLAAGTYTATVQGDDGTNQITLSNITVESCPLFTGTITVNKQLFPITDLGRFNLLIDGVPGATAVGNGGTTGAVTVLVGLHTVSETAAPGTNLSDYNSTYSCTNGLTGTGTTTPAFLVTFGDDEEDEDVVNSVTCTFTNQHKVIPQVLGDSTTTPTPTVTPRVLGAALTNTGLPIIAYVMASLTIVGTALFVFRRQAN